MVTIDIYSDVICPWCYIGKRRMEKGLAGRAATVRWHPFELNPKMPPEGIERRAYRIKKFGSWERSLELDAQVGRAFAGEGLMFNPEKMARTPNTFDAHRIIWRAGEKGVQDTVVEALFKAYFTDGRNLSDRATLAAVAVTGGLDAKEVDEVLAGDRGAAEVREWEQKGQRLGISGVPFFVINGTVALSGAQPPEMFRAAIEQASETSTGDTCEVDPATGKRRC
ncbi:dsba oxidoreductase : Putative dithiol-disulfide isomerase involved in polyketide biosynthesis OS=Singulisphaera acidiphila (strain ATCC BAA-1392 / DSM 18658 / VKM B-2454 / MOB10) GN=Sinac_7138 PE=4 SV=1: DSBA [Gemmataceae bacterium]|nr:dsba oxidoreductase : Putative dithiol-disulfide isomerase involved in polyketide biosynthesis OS=Singulisphaera acidiphila (strain ATCC BAA-1392 / DSM 18658 / VKM B-2454 / MOB10) GN=Sinac_7138 PE=4 SV=1: DSBA [Gemmataceae bacterium]VTT98789.1 dsba oxidoreductase : Putative dithiol-disulfide isomerase involved in polyketide biosynthesis OS=Singulisphaera acidiphila (strain ATCC BAA-1392 / DSM 18658 / VKM B-2454 / MOB10) GN=Sinac_7138 PE=4 SV=1: DSBA [Gemmataceae bacterium]